MRRFPPGAPRRGGQKTGKPPHFPGPVINCNNVHALKGTDNLFLLQLHISYQLLREVVPDTGMVFACNSSADAFHPYGELRRIMRQMLFSYAGARKKTEALRYSYVYELLDILTEQFQVQLEEIGQSRPQRDEVRLQEIIRYVNQNFQEEINLSRLAEQMYLSTSSLSRLFKKNMGCYFADFVNRVRLNHAVKELEETEKTVTRIAADCGFSNLAAFNKQFQNAYQMSPSAYRHQAWEEREAQEEKNLSMLEEGARQLHSEEGRESAGPGERSLSVELRAADGFQIAVRRVSPALPPYLSVLLVVPVHGVLLVAFPSAGRKPDTLAVLVKVVDLPALGEPLALFVHRPHGQKDVGVGISIPLVMDGKVGNHALGNEKLPAVVPDKVGVL